MASYSMYAEVTIIIFFSLKTQTIKPLECCYYVHATLPLNVDYSRNVYQIYKFRSGNLFFFFVFLGSYPRCMVVPRLGVGLELQPLVYSTDTEDLSLVCNLHHRQRQILNPLSKARDQTCLLMVRFVSTEIKESYQQSFYTHYIVIFYLIAPSLLQ